MTPHNQSVAFDRLIFATVCLALCIMVALAGCQTTTPVPTPTPTRTPILPTPTPTLTPTATPTLTPSPTVTPSPTLPPSLVMPAEVRGLPDSGGGQGCPTLPADLYFVRDASLWVCLAHGGTPEPITVAAEAKTQRIAEYRLTPDGRYITYATEAGELFVFDRARWQHTYIPTSGRLIDPNGTHFALTEDGTTLFYLAWGVQPSSGPAVEEVGSASLLSIDVTAPTRLQQVEAVCRGLSGQACGGFLVSPDEGHAAFVDAQGVWSLPLRTPLGPAVTLQRAEDVAEVRQLGIAAGQEIRIDSWSPDGEWLLLELGSPTAPSLLLLARDADSVALATASSTFCGDDCVIGTAWDGDRLWISWDAGAQGCIQATDTGELAGPLKILHPETPTCQVGSTPLHPRSPGPARHTWMGTDLEGAVSFLQPAVPGIWPGLYTYALTGELVPRVLLPETDGTLIWTGAGDAFLYIDHDQAPAYLGDLTTPVLWDVHELLQGAYSFTWSQSTAPLGDQ